MSLGSVLYFAIRYIGIVYLCVSIAITVWPRQVVSQLHCDDASFKLHIHALDKDMDVLSYWLVPVLQFIIFWLVEVTMQMRIFALYNIPMLAAANGVLFSAEVTAMVLMWRWSPDTIGASGDTWDLIAVQPYYAETFLEVYPQISLLYWTPGIAFELWLAGLAVAKMRRKVLKRDLLGSLINDSLKYFLMMAVLIELHVVLSFYQHGSYAVPFVIAGETVGGSRLILHLRKAYYGRKVGGTSHILQQDISFAVSAKFSTDSRRRLVDDSFYDTK